MNTSQYPKRLIEVDLPIKRISIKVTTPIWKGSVMSRELKEGWFVRGSMRETLRNILTTADLGYIKTVHPAEFEKQLIDEVRFLAPYNKEEIQAVEQYIHQHLD